MANRTAEDWGRIATGLPGWRWMPGMRCRQRSDVGTLEPWEAAEVAGAHRRYMGCARGKHWAVFRPSKKRGLWSSVSVRGGGAWHWPDPDDPATAGCLLALLGPGEPTRSMSLFVRRDGFEVDFWTGPTLVYRTPGPFSSVGRACIAAAEALGHWPGGVT